MREPRRRWNLFTVGIALLAIPALPWFLYFRNHSSSAYARASWQTGGEDKTIYVIVLGQDGRSRLGVSVVTESNSGTSDPIDTDENGIAVIRPGEADVRRLEIDGRDVMKRDFDVLSDLLSPSCADGIWFEVSLRK